MITSTDLVKDYNNFWKETFPALEHYVRLINAGGCKRVFDDKHYQVQSDRNALISETAFCLLKNKKISISKAYEEARKRLYGLPGTRKSLHPLDSSEKDVVRDIKKRSNKILENCIPKGAKIHFTPHFLGCGSLKESYGDAVVNSQLLEFKSVNRNFHSNDFRQVVTYILQSLVSGEYQIQEFCLVNPKKGIYFESSLEKFLFDTCAPNLIDLQNKFLSVVGCGGTSR